MTMREAPIDFSSISPSVLTIEEAAKILRLSRNTVYSMCRDGQIGGSKIGREWRIRREELERVLREGVAGPPPARSMPVRNENVANDKRKQTVSR